MLLPVPGECRIARGQLQFLLVPKVARDFYGEGIETGSELLPFLREDRLPHFLQYPEHRLVFGIDFRYTRSMVFWSTAGCA